MFGYMFVKRGKLIWKKVDKNKVDVKRGEVRFL